MHSSKKIALDIGVAMGIVMLLFVIGGPPLVAAHGDGVYQGIIHSCVDDKSGKIRIVTGDEECPKNESALDWNGEGPQGPAGPQGPVGPQGPPGVLTFYVVTEINDSIPAYSEGDAYAYCDFGDLATGGGYRSIGMSSELILRLSAPITTMVGENVVGIGWYVTVYNNTGIGGESVMVYAVCADMTP